jgi:carboxylesterase type B
MFLSNIVISITAVVALTNAQSVTLTKFGIVNGAKCATSNSNAFLSLPYANSPIGSLRFAAPEPYNGTYPFTGLSATTKPPSCIQFGSEFVEPLPWSEDW